MCDNTSEKWDHEPTAGELHLCGHGNDTGEEYTLLGVKIPQADMDVINNAVAVTGRTVDEQIIAGAVMQARYDIAQDWAKKWEGRPYLQFPDRRPPTELKDTKAEATGRYGVSAPVEIVLDGHPCTDGTETHVMNRDGYMWRCRNCNASFRDPDAPRAITDNPQA